MESQLENALRNWCKRKGYWCLKLVLSRQLGWPDRTILMPGGRVVFLELKQPGGKRRARQKYWIGRLREFGFTAEFVDDLEHAIALIEDA